MRRTIWQKRIPTLLGLIIITIGIGITSFLTKSGVTLTGKASPAETPKNVRITNITNNSFTVSYTTESPFLGEVVLGKDKSFGKTAVDDKDQQSGKLTPRKIHHITIRSLEPITKYYFEIISGQTSFLNQDNGDNSFEVTTGESIQTDPPQQGPITGRVVLPDGKITEAIIYLTAQNTQAISTLLNSDGSYILPLNSIRNQNFNAYSIFNKDTVLEMLIVGESLSSKVMLLASQINPVPTITLSRDYDFTIGVSPITTSAATTVSGSAGFSGLPSFSANPAKKESKVLIPKEKEGFSDSQPLFKGTASPEANVKIIIHSEEEIEIEVQADKNGNWSYRPTKQLSPGEHTVSVLTKDQFGIIKTITRTFTVYAQGSQVNQSATPSATPTITITATPSATPLLTPTLSPTPTLMPTFTPTPSPTLTLAPTNKPKAPGNVTFPIAGIAAMAVMTIGVLLFIISRGTISL